MKCNSYSFALAVAGALALIGSGCDNVDWVTVVADADPPSGFRFRDAEVWSFGSAVHRRAGDGSWTQVDLCGAYQPVGTGNSSVSVAFDGEDVWALCSAGNQALIHWSAGEGERVALPVDGLFSLLDIDGDVVIAGETSLHRRDGDEWIAFATYPERWTQVEGAGVSVDDIYVVARGSSPGVLLQHADDDAWTEVPNDESNNLPVPWLRAGRAWLGAMELVDGELREPDFSAALWKDAERRGLALGAYLPSGFGVFNVIDDQGTHLWSAQEGDKDLSFLGDGPFTAGTWSAGGGIGDMVAIDEQTVLIVYSEGAGVWAGEPRYSFVEGRL